MGLAQAVPLGAPLLLLGHARERWRALAGDLRRSAAAWTRLFTSSSWPCFAVALTCSTHPYLEVWIKNGYRIQHGGIRSELGPTNSQEAGNWAVASRGIRLMSMTRRLDSSLFC
jgi:hypothetical protein